MTAENKIRFGLKNIYYSLITEGAEGTVTFAKPVAIKGAKSLSLDQEGESASVYYDDGPYVTTVSNNGYTGSLEVALLPDQFLIDVFGYVKTADGGLAEDAAKLSKPFALLFECQGDANATRHIFYKVTASRPNTEANTKEEGIDPDNQSMDITAVPIEKDSHSWVKTSYKTGAKGYETLFTTAPTLPTENTLG